MSRRSRECEAEKKPKELSENLEESHTNEEAKKTKISSTAGKWFHKGRNFCYSCVSLLFIPASVTVPGTL